MPFRVWFSKICVKLCKKAQFFTYKIIAPKNLDLELNCKNDLVIHDDFQIDSIDEMNNLKAHDDK